MQEQKKDESTVCPNCGFAATRNYCAQCGQETHLHKETFIGLLTHFVGHYFHYDSKFWVTLKTLFTKPGMLTVAYWERKRMRFIPPISLYIFVSIVFFFLFFSTVGSDQAMRRVAEYSNQDSSAAALKADSLKVVELERDTTERGVKMRRLYDVLGSQDGITSLLSRIARNAPKVFFFMIPIMAFILKLLYGRRKNVHFGDHAIFSLHIHALAFIMLLPYLYALPEVGRNWLDHIFGFIRTILPFAGFLYLLLAIHNAYKSSWVKSGVYSFIISAGYLVFFILVVLGYIIFVFVRTYQSL